MKTIEFFSGTKSFSKVAKERGHSILTYDYNYSIFSGRGICMRRGVCHRDKRMSIYIKL